MVAVTTQASLVRVRLKATYLTLPPKALEHDIWYSTRVTREQPTAFARDGPSDSFLPLYIKLN